MASDQLARLQKRLAAIPEKVKEAIQPALKLSADELVARMQSLVPVDEGDLKASIASTPAGQTTPSYSQPGGSRLVQENQVMITAGNAKVRYPHLVEYGTTHAAPQPYFWVSYRLLRMRISRRIKRSISKAVREGWSK
jgi:hypothetical protein